MDNSKYNSLVSKHTPKEDKLFNVIKSFLVGGGIGLFAEIFVDFLVMFDIKVDTARSYMIIFLIFIGSLFTALGFFDNIVAEVRAGIIVPITGFAHAMTSAALEYKKEGYVAGIGANIFKLTGTVILYGVVSAYVFGILRYIFFGG